MDLEAADKKNVISCVLHNDTDSEIGRAWEAILQYREIGQDAGSYCTTNIPRIPAHGKETIELKLYSTSVFGSGKSIDPTSGVLSIKKQGLVFADGKVEVNIVDGGEYHVRLSSIDPPLSDTEYKSATQAIRDLLEGSSSSFPISSLFRTARKRGEKEETHGLWASVVKAIGRVEASNNKESVEKVKEMITSGTCYANGRAKFIDLFQNHPRKPVLDTSVSAEDIQSALKEGKAKVIVYYRAVDRFPGGNSDCFVNKFTLDLEKGETTAIQWSDWDGSSSFSSSPVPFPTLSERFKQQTVPALCELAGEKDREGRDGSLLFVSTVDDQSMDSDEYDTEWTSIEILVYLPHKQLHQDEAKPVMHVHQYSVYPNWSTWGNPTPAVVNRIKAGDKLEKVLNSLEHVFEIGKPAEFSEGNDTSKKLSSNKDDLVHVGYINPVYIKL